MIVLSNALISGGEKQMADKRKGRLMSRPAYAMIVLYYAALLIEHHIISKVK